MKPWFVFCPATIFINTTYNPMRFLFYRVPAPGFTDHVNLTLTTPGWRASSDFVKVDSIHSHHAIPYDRPALLMMPY